MRSTAFYLILLLFIGFPVLGEGTRSTESGSVPAIKQSPSDSQSKVKTIIVAELVRRMTEAPDSLVIVDLRTDREREIGTIPGNRSIKMEAIGSDSVKASLPHDKLIVLYCSHGFRSANASRTLTEAGFNTASLVDGFGGWQHYLEEHPSVMEELKGSSGE